MRRRNGRRRCKRKGEGWEEKTCYRDHRDIRKTENKQLGSILTMMMMMMMIAFVNVAQKYATTLYENRFIHLSLILLLTLCSTENASGFALNYILLRMRSLPCRLH